MELGAYGLSQAHRHHLELTWSRLGGICCLLCTWLLSDGQDFSNVLMDFVSCAGFRHPSPTTVSRTIRVLHHLMAITVKSTNRDKFEVTTETVAYLAGRRRSIYSQTQIKEWFDGSKHLE